jgi:putative ABC transport system ATP-binding protein
MMASTGLKITKLSVAYSPGNESIRALSNIDLEVRAGQFVIIVGPNGSGKTTLLRAICGGCPVERGTIELVEPEGTHDFSTMTPRQRFQHIAQVHQDPKVGTVASMTVFENLRLATLDGKVPSPLRFDSEKRGRNWFRERLEPLGLTDRLDSRVSDLSQGQRQLLALELALLRQPSILLADEHTASLDEDNARNCLEATVKLCQRQGTTVLMVTHDLVDALEHGNRLIVLRAGKIHADIDEHLKCGLTLPALIELCGFRIRAA